MTDIKDPGADITDIDKYQHGVGSDPDMEGLTLYEKKALLVNRELDAHGMGKYQWYIWFLCGFGYMLDLLWAQAFGLVASPLQQELGFAGMRCHVLASFHTTGYSLTVTRYRTREYLRSILGWAHRGGKHIPCDSFATRWLMRKRT